MEIISRKDARFIRQTWYFTGNPCKNGHIAKRWTASQMCSKCEYAKTVKRRCDDPEWRKPSDVKYRANRRNQRNEYNRLYRQRKPHIKCADQAKRNACKINATPSWLTTDDLENMKRLYEHASHISANTGIPHEVDHMIPLRGKTVCGLHVPWNLQILTQEQNIRKSNRL